MAPSNVRTRPPRRSSSGTAPLSHDYRSRSSTTYNDQMVKILMAIVIVAGTVNIAIFGRYADTIPEMHLPANMMHPSNSNRDGRVQEVSDVDLQMKGGRSSLGERLDKTAERVAADAGDSDRIRKLVENAGVKVTPDIASRLPTWSSVVAQYGSEPVIVGLDTCERYRSTIPKADAMTGTAGIFNTGTNLLSTLMSQNCYIPDKAANWRGRVTNGMEWQVPWGKHSPASWRFKHSTEGAKRVNQTAVLPVVTIKDPYHWMGSMCRKSYVCNWPHTKVNCPNLLKGGKPNEARVRYSPENRTRHESLVGVWNDYYRQYLDAPFPRLIIRFEDLLFHPDYVLTKVCECVGGVRWSDTVENVKGNAKGGQPAHEGGSDLIGAVTRYGDYRKRAEGFSDVDRNYAATAIDKELADMFNYKVESKIKL